MKKRNLSLLGLMVGFLFIGVDLFAADGDLIVNGNVGIGTTSPQSKLQVMSPLSELRIWLRTTATDGNIYYVVENDARRYNMGISGWNNDSWHLWDETAAAPRITVTPEGNVGLYTNAPGSYRLYVNGITYSVGGYQSSDVDYKENIGLIESPLSKILAMEGVSFSWRKDEETKDKGFPEGRHYGVIAQSVEKVLPEIVKEGPNGEKAVAYTEIIPILIEAIKEQQKEIIKLKGDLEALKK
jgi:hypothetical protein